jgi:putative cell wall-binding protein
MQYSRSARAHRPRKEARDHLPWMMPWMARIAIVAILILAIAPLGSFALDGSTDNPSGDDSADFSLFTLEPQASYPLQFVDADGTSDDAITVNVYTGGDAYAKYKLTNTSSQTVYVNGLANNTYGSLWFDQYTHEPVNASYDDEQGAWGIPAGATATFYLYAEAGNRSPQTNTYQVQICKSHIEYGAGGQAQTVVDTVQTASIPVKINIYNPQDAKLQVGTSNDAGATINQFPSSGIDLGTVNLATLSSNYSSNKVELSFFIKNATTTVDPYTGAIPEIKYDYDLTTAGKLGEVEPYAFQLNTSGRVNGHLVVKVGFNPTNYVAGTYTANFKLTTVPHGVKVNGTAASAAGVATIPVKITLTGTNPNLGKRISGLTATAGNDLVELNWTNASDTNSVNVYRREGIETQTDPDKIDLSAYELVGEVSAYSTNATRFVDATARNGETYSYVVMDGTPFRGYPSKAATATPDASLAAKLPAPENFSASGSDGYVSLGWDIGDTSDDGTGTIDHFNVYQDHRLVAQVDQSAVSASVLWSDQSVRSYGWSVSVPLSDGGIEHEWYVTAVALDGTEGYVSDSAWAGSTPSALAIVNHHAWYSKSFYDETTGQSRHCMLVRINPYNSPGALRWLEFWRAEGTTAPDTSSEPYMRVSKNHAISSFYTQHDLEDYDITLGKTYTYTVRGKDQAGVPTDFYTFTVKAVTPSDNDNVRFLTPEVTCKVQDASTVTLTFDAYSWDDGGYPATYKVYRNDVLIKTIGGTGRKVVTDTPTAGDTYVYRVDQEVAGVTARGHEFTFSRDTAPVNPSEMGKAPGAPELVGRVSVNSESFSGDAGVVMLEWTPSDEGGEVQGYHIYRKDAGDFVEGSYYHSSWHLYLAWGLDRYITIPNAEVRSFVEKGNAYNDDARQGKLTGVYWDGDSAPHEYYVTAYNQYGESAPSNLVTFPYAGGSAPANQDEAAPNAPRIKRAWVEWSDRSNASDHLESGTFDEYASAAIHVAFEEPAGGGVDSYRVQFENESGDGEPHDYNGDGMIDDTSWSSEDMPRWAFVRWPSLLSGVASDTDSSRYLPSHTVSYYDYGQTFTVTATAKNSLGETVSQPVQVVVYSIPLIQVRGGSGHALVRWSELFHDTTTTVTAWELYRVPEHGLPQLVGSFDPDVHEYDDTGVRNGWSYTYHVVAKCADGIDRRSVDAGTSVSAANETPAAPTNLEAHVVNGEVVLSWTQPETGGEAEGYSCDIIAPGEEWPDENAYLYSLIYTAGTGTSLTLQSQWLDKDMRIRIYAFNREGSARSAASNEATFKLTSAQYAQRATKVPDIVWIHGTAGTGSCTLTWDSSTNSSYPPASYYVLTRTGPGTYDKKFFTIPVKGTGAQSYEYVDNTVENGVTYTYEVRAYNNAGEQSGNWNYNNVSLTPTGRTHDQEVAESVTALIDALPSPEDVTIGDSDAIEALQAIWDGLSDTQKRLVGPALAQKLSDDVQVLEDKQLMEEYGELIEGVQALIDDLPAAGDVTLADKEQIEAARAAYEAIEPAKVKRFVNTGKLVEAEAKLAALDVIALIDALPAVGDLTLDDASAVAAARSFYESLTAEQKAFVANLGTLEAAEQRVADLQAAAAVSDLIGALSIETSNKTFAANKAQVVAAREAYDALNDDGRTLVGAEPLARLVAAELMIAQKQGAYDEYVAAPVRDAIGQLPDPDDVILEHAEAVTQAKAAFDGLSDSQKALIDEELQDKLQGCADKIDVLQREYATSAGNLAAAITAAKNAKAGIATSTDGANVADGKKWTTSAELKALNNAITAANGVLNDDDATKAQIDAATINIKKATSTYNANKKLWHRIWGATAPDTMLNITKRFGKTSVAVVTTDASYKDALAASSLAGRYNGLVLMTKKGSLTAQTKTALKNAGVKTVFLVGSTKDVSAKVATQLKSGTGVKTVTRISGNSASAKAIAVAKKTGKKSDTVIIATQNGFQDALSIAPYSYATKSPILYAEGNKKLSTATVNYIKSAKYKKAIIVGGPIALPASIDTQLTKAGIKKANITRIAGLNAYSTSQLIAKWTTGKQANGNVGKYKGKTLAYFKFKPSVVMKADKLAVSTGQNWLDALAGAALCGKNRSVMLLADSKTKKSNYTLARDYCKSNKAIIKTSAYVFGGPKAVQANVWNALVAATK